MMNRHTGKKLKKKKKKKKQRIQKRKKNGIEQAKLAYLSFLCEEDDINFFCTFEDDWEEKKSRRDSNEATLVCYNNFNTPHSKHDALEHSYLYTLIRNENFTCDKRSCSSVRFIFDKLFLRFTNLDEQLRRDIYFGKSFRKGKRRKIKVAKEKTPMRGIQTGASKYCANKNRVFPDRPYANLEKESNLTERRITYEDDEDAIFHHLAYSHLQDNLLQFYLPPGGYACTTSLRKDRTTPANEDQRRQRCDIGAECSKPNEAPFSRGKLSTRGVKKKKRENILSTAKRKGSHHVGGVTERVKKKRTGSTYPFSLNSFFRLYNYSSSEDSHMSFSKFLPDQFRKKKKNKINEKKNKFPETTSPDRKKPHKMELQNDATAIFDEIIQLCRRKKIFRFKEQKRKYARRCNGAHLKGEPTVFPAELSDDGKMDHSYTTCNRALNPSTGRNLSACPIMSGFHEGFRNPHIRAHILVKGATPHAFHLMKKRSFNESSPIVERLSEQSANSKTAKVCRLGAPLPTPTVLHPSHVRHHRDYASSIVASNCAEQREELTGFQNLMNAKRGEEKKQIKMEILEGLNQRSYDPGHLERMVSSKCLNIGKERLRHTLKRNVEMKLVGEDNNRMKKKKEPIGELSWLKKWASARKIHFSSLYMEKKYEIIVQLYRQEYPLNDFYLTYLYVMALMKLKRYALCWEYLLSVTRIREVHGATTTDSSIRPINGIDAWLVHFLWGKLYEKLLMYRLSAVEYLKVVLHHMGKSIPSLHTRLRPEAVTGASHTGIGDIQAFILVCLDKLIGTGQLKRREEITTLKFVQMNCSLGRILNFYFCKVGSDVGFIQNPNDYTHTRKDDVTFGYPSHRNRHKSCVGPVRSLRPPPFCREGVVHEGSHALSTSDHVKGEWISNDSYIYDHFSNTKRNCIQFSNAWKATSPCPSEQIERMRNSAVGKRKGRGYPQQAPLWRDHRQPGEVLLSIPRHHMHAQGNINIRKSYQGVETKQNESSHHGGISHPGRLLQMGTDVNRMIHLNASNFLRGDTSESDELLGGREMNIMGRYSLRSETFMGGHEVEDLSQKQFLVHFNFLLRNGHFVSSHRVVLPHYDDFFVCLFRVYFSSTSKWLIKRAMIWGGNAPSNKGALKTARRIGMRLKLIDVCPVDVFSRKEDRPICYEEIVPAVGKQSTSMYCVDHPFWSGKSARIEKLTLPDLLHIIWFCHKHFDFVNAYYLSEYALRRENALEEEDIILLFVTSITSMHSVVYTSQEKTERLLQLYNARTSHTSCKAIQYNQGGKQHYGYMRDHLDYYLHGVIALLKEDYDQALLYLKKCVSAKGNFFLAYVYILHILCSSPKGSTLNSREKKKIFHHCLQLKPFSLSPYLVYCSCVLKKLQLDLNHEREKRGNEKRRKEKLLIESTTFLRGIFFEAMHLDNKNPFLYNELFVYHFLRKDFIQCKIVLRKMLLIQDISTPCCSYFPLSVVLYNSSVFYFLCENHLNKSEKKVIEILHNNPFDIKALNLLTFLLFLKKDKYWTRFFDYSMYVERSLLSRNLEAKPTYLCQNFFKRLRETRDLGLLARYYASLNLVRTSFPFVLNYIHTRYSA
ncbi:conserved Plasmodium protein, unknown function [Plasmodium knowlesi strain H]|uniref:Uncharacterized protein n=3 Tax=Plasmodium knowlesi TaxID=5850 RepID=A0A5K1VG96_PLAKH|nr:conserved Plasmodium protein, unknown function [Plasmodium knowlesi strain H]OTN64956.1 Uncharacterized protein PKNOH_S120133700 [Plasmodium knowlesi]CAA9988196.1 conserved Plasmodium protein, unknown function [Plasmodium knowlesi strain H]SBO20115.1 conserved Plasmodium protein, unknown function [Plasmodium knowlesi strain H]SBO20646.1 conserved Plasmodium protein, unknown function [Plasmodium knowlesi strain H]VVS77670.1 conserved Plasmodium protein, unknown function [Plasmodium knowlesi |eukprot:XP_002259173.1 hypothetical protein, conserved in Plasmodium species [Plasmodium knowlesi strain H]